MSYIECPTIYEGTGPSIFLAGGITNCPDWQEEARRWFNQFSDITILNPRRENFPMDDPGASEFQIAWEFDHLEKADVILFWFAGGPSPQPIALYELGRHAAIGKKIAVGCDPNYSRKADVFYQLILARPTVLVHENLFWTCQAAKNLIST